MKVILRPMLLTGINTDKLFARAPIDEVMLKEKLNGWGRTLRGLERLGAKLKKNPTTAHQGAQVLEYTANAWLSRKLQSGNLETVLKKEFVEIIVRLQRYGVKFNGTMQLRFTKRWITYAFEDLNEGGEDEATRVNDISSPFKIANEVEAKFTEVDPKLRHLDAPHNSCEHVRHDCVGAIRLGMHLCRRVGSPEVGYVLGEVHP